MISDWTVSIPTCNRYDFLKDAVNSAASQIVPPDQIVISDNSTINREFDLPKWTNRVKLTYHKQVKQISAWQNFKFCLDCCNTKFFSWLQDDDYMFSDFSVAALPYMLADESIGAIIGYAYYNTEIDRLFSLRTLVWGPPPFKMNLTSKTPLVLPQFSLIPWLASYWPGYSPIAIYRTSLIKKVINSLPEPTGYSLFLGEKRVIAGLNSMASIAYLPFPCGVIRQHGENMTHNHNDYSTAEKAEAIAVLHNELHELIRNNLDEAETFFSDNLSYFSSSEIDYMLNSLGKPRTPFANLLSAWIYKYSVGHIINENNQQTNYMILGRKIAKSILPPFLVWIAVNLYSSSWLKLRHNRVISK